jgi:iron(III) transport system permease protein
VGESRVRRRDIARVGAGVSRAVQPVRLGGLRFPLGGAAGVVLALALVFPIGSLLWWFLNGLSAGIDGVHLAESVAATAWLALLGAVACTLGAVPVGILAARHRGSFTTVVEQITYAGHALPGIVVALALVFLGVRVVPWVYQEAPLLVLAYVVLFVPTAVGAVRSSVAQSSVRGEEVARSLGATPGDVLRRVTLPLAAPGIAAGGALVLLTCMKELPATLLLRPTGTDTLATSLWTETGVGAYGAAAPYGLALVVLAVLPTIWLMRLTDRERGTPR